MAGRLQNNGYSPSYFTNSTDCIPVHVTPLIIGLPISVDLCLLLGESSSSAVMGASLKTGIA